MQPIMLFRIVTIVMLCLAAAPIAAQTETPPSQVVEVIEIDLIAGAMASSAYLSPDGEHFLYVTPVEFCLYRTAGELQGCTAVPRELRSIDFAAVRWSHNGRYVALTENSLVYFHTSGLWLFDTHTGAFSNITGDEATMFHPGNLEGHIDLKPQWLSDGRLLFLRLEAVPLVDGFASVLYTIDADGGNLERVGMLDAGTMAVFALAVSPDDRYVAYNHGALGTPEARNGLWIHDLEEGQARQLFLADEPLHSFEAPMAMAFSTDSEYVLGINAALHFQQGDQMPEQSPVRIAPVDGSQAFLVDDEVMVWSAAWSPTGGGLAYVVRDPTNPDVSGLYLSPVPGERGELVLSGLFTTVNSEVQSLSFGANGAILLSRAPEPGIVVVYVGLFDEP
jgi:hypothetical protein